MNNIVKMIRWVGHVELWAKSQMLTEFFSEILKGRKLSGKKMSLIERYNWTQS
jgi:hypothetical protein